MSEKTRKPEVTLNVDHQGLMTYTATGVMLVKDIFGKACPRVLRVLYDSGGLKSMCHNRVIPAGAQMGTNKRQLFGTLAGAYASKENVQLNGIRLPAFDKNRMVEGHDFEVF